MYFKTVQCADGIRCSLEQMKDVKILLAILLSEGDKLSTLCFQCGIKMGKK